MQDKEIIFLAALSKASKVVNDSADTDKIVYGNNFIFNGVIESSELYFKYPTAENLQKLKWNQTELFKLAYARPNPYGLVFKMTARTVYTASKLAVWAAAQQATVKANEAAFETARQVDKLIKWTELSHTIKVCNKKVYEPAEDSFLLADAAINQIIYKSREIETVLEIGCGSGIVSHLIQTQTDTKVIAVDINTQAVKCAIKNGVNAINSNLFKNVTGKFDMIVFNPPYLADSEHEETGDMLDKALFGGPTGREIIDQFLKDAREYLTDYGIIMIVISNETSVVDVKKKASQLGYVNKEVESFEKLTVLRFDSHGYS